MIRKMKAETENEAVNYAQGMYNDNMKTKAHNLILDEKRPTRATNESVHPIGLIVSRSMRTTLETQDVTPVFDVQDF